MSVVVVVNFFTFSTTRICFTFCVDVPLGDHYQACLNRGATPIYIELWVIL